jgi:hypothetical protein
MNKPKIFISYSSHDIDWARSFAKALKERDVSVWFDEFDLSPGEPLREGLEAALRDSDVLVVVIGPDHPAGPALFFELGAAIGMNKKVVPIVPKDIDPHTLPFDLRLRRYMFRQTPEETADELSHSLSAA